MFINNDHHQCHLNQDGAIVGWFISKGNNHTRPILELLDRA